ncbi:16S rRNA (cytidine(1402)-2'-O)-methyltransferase [Nitratireductor alexandrii]|uniref:16S rRNA (cytidine(1402)-2'-O)-methyltransferase n=1 Tax=Nitratireductor alexandrii TaxID=2448161 RepID=UPI000FD9BE48|nr:16S rRNA (cytidine(1402)-2'-O)-methyltransferase [Nitratireductor alexandrii]
MNERAPERRFVIGQAALTARAPEPALYLVATPIGNLADITIRALETLAAVDIVACEDTRITRRLLERYAIRRKPVAYHEHNAAEAGPKLLAALGEGRSVALVSDAGTPLVSDPGFRLARQALGEGIKVVPVPGASAPLAALVASGLPSDSFLFAGFLPAKAGQRRTRLAALAPVAATLIFFESPRRLADTLAAMAETLGASRQAAVCRELTKAYEEVRRGTLAELARHYAETGAPKGEVVVCVAPPDAAAPPAPEEIDALLLDLAAEMPAAKAAGEAARMTGGAKAELYRRLIALKAETDVR